MRKKLLASHFLFLYSCVLIIGGSLLYQSGYVHYSPGKSAKYLEEKLQKKEKNSRGKLKELKEELVKNEIYGFEKLFKSNDESISYYYFENDTLKYWTNNNVPFDNSTNQQKINEGIVQLNNGYYRLIKEEWESSSLCALIQIKRQYFYENQYLLSGFNDDYGFYFDAKILLEKSTKSIDVNSANGEFLFSLDIKNEGEKPLGRMVLVIAIILFGLAFLLWFFIRLSVLIESKLGKIQALIIVALLLVGLRLLSLYYGFPFVFYELELFKPSIYATSFLFPSLGDFLVNIVLIFFIINLIAKAAEKYKTSRNKPSMLHYVITVLLCVIVILYSVFVTAHFVAMIENSNISFNINNFFRITIYSVLGLIIIAGLYLTFFILVKSFTELIKKFNIPTAPYIAITLIVAIIVFAIVALSSNMQILDVVWGGVIMLIVGRSVYRNQETFSFNSIVGILIVFSLTSAHIISKRSDLREKENRLVYAEKLSSEEDAITEYEYSELEPELKKSELLYSPFDTSVVFDKTQFDKEIENNYFKDYWDNYDIKYHLYSADGLSISSDFRLDKNALYRNIGKFDEIISRYGKTSSIHPNIIYISNYYDKLSYLIRLEIKQKGNLLGYLVCRLKSKKIPEDIGFPELLIDKNTKTIEELIDYSYARYSDNKIVTALGKYNYSITPDEFLREGNKKHFYYQDDNFDHLVYKIHEGSLLVLSKEEDNFLTRATSFSYLFTLFGLISVVVFAFKDFPHGFRALNFTLENKMQFLLVVLILASLFLFGLGTRYYIKNQYSSKNDSIISEKIESVKTELIQKLGAQEHLDKDDKDLRNYLNDYILPKFSRVFFTEIILYDSNGDLLASSRPKIFDAGLLSKKMNSRAYVKMIEKKKKIFIHEEQIGELKYLSGYVPFVNNQNKILAYLNLPYILKQNEFENEFSSFLEAIVNVSIVLFALSILAALFASKWITRPLRLLQTSLANIEFGKTNEPIEYKGNDEISNLVKEYNKKVVELQKNAEQLAKSERESAWREMAKQVAHEIKNPLTPMKLRIQHMLRSFDEKDPDAKEKLNNVAESLIEQIDSLSIIANEFSNFAKMPKPKEEIFDLEDILSRAIELYGESPEAEIIYNQDSIKEAKVKSDKEQILRVFNNLISNALQSIPSNREGKIEIGLDKRGNNFVVEIRDNGEGIGVDKRDKIFVPNFTTKSKGMGLGLAMVKNILEAASGEIWFESEEGKGTSFFVSLPIHED